MIVRIVKMTFKSEAIQQFKDLFKDRKEKIRTMPGCMHLELLQDIHNSTVFFTYSYWDREEDLENYRHSALFKDTWQKTKVLFADKAQAWSVKSKHRL